MTQAEKIAYIINKSCMYFGVTPDELRPHHNPKTEYVTDRRFIIKALSDNTTLSHLQIAKLLGYKQDHNVRYHYNVLNNDLSNEVYGSEKTKRLYREYITYLNL